MRDQQGSFNLDTKMLRPVLALAFATVTVADYVQISYFAGSNDCGDLPYMLETLNYEGCVTDGLDSYVVNCTSDLSAVRTSFTGSDDCSGAGVSEPYVPFTLGWGCIRDKPLFGSNLTVCLQSAEFAQNPLAPIPVANQYIRNNFPKGDIKCPPSNPWTWMKTFPVGVCIPGLSSMYGCDDEFVREYSFESKYKNCAPGRLQYTTTVATLGCNNQVYVTDTVVTTQCARVNVTAFGIAEKNAGEEAPTVLSNAQITAVVEARKTARARRQATGNKREAVLS